MRHARAALLCFAALSFEPAAATDMSFPSTIALGGLNGATGFRLDGIAATNYAGSTVRSAGDVNGDGHEDLIVGAKSANSGRGQVYVVFGKSGSFASPFALSSINGANGFRLDGIDLSDEASVAASAGDFNNDGYGDLVIGAKFADPDGKDAAGEVYVVFGHSGSFPAALSLASLTGPNGFRLDGIAAGNWTGGSVASAGDVNRDGFDDVIIGASGANTYTGESYVVFGHAAPFPASFDLSLLNGANGIRLPGVDSYDYSGGSVASAGDVNRDGFDDIIIGADDASPNGGFLSDGESYVVFGGASLPANLPLASLNGQNGFRMRGVAPADQNGYSVASAGDVNGDGYDDVVTGAPHAGNTGRSYVIFGKRTGYTQYFDLTTLNGANGFRIDGTAGEDRSGASVAAAGDVNGDGFDDVIVGAPEAAASGNAKAGQSFVVFGKASGFGPTLLLSALNGATGFRLDGIDQDDNSGISASTAGDLNGDGFDDAVIGASGADPGNRVNAGESYVVFGRAPTEAVTRVGAAANQTIRGGPLGDTLDGRGGNDRLFGAGGADRLLGGTGGDRLYGGPGLDSLDGGPGYDFLFGGADADTFLFARAFGLDTIADWQDSTGPEPSYDGLDRINLVGLRSANGGAPLARNDLMIVQSGANVLITLDLDHDGATDSLDLDGNGTLDNARITVLRAQVANFGTADFIF